MNVLRTTATVLALALAAPTLAHAQDDALHPLQKEQERLAREAGAAVVAFGHPRRMNFRTPTEALDAQAGGAGFVIDAEGDIITDASLVPAQGDVVVTFRGGHRARAKVLAQDPHTHVALMRLADPSGTAARLGGKLPVLALGHSNELKRGRLVGTVGNPYESIETDGVPAFSLGVVSAIGRLRDADAYKGYVIETDAAVNPGSFGGPLIDAHGRAVGVILEAYSTKRWLGVAVPMDEVALALEDLKAGHAPRGPRLGLALAGAGEASGEGVLVKAVEKDGPAARAGVRAGDRLRALDGSRIAEPFDLSHELADLAQGAPVDLELVREGKTVALTAVLDASSEETIATGLPLENEIPIQKPAPAPRADGKPYAGLNVEDKDDGVYISQVVAGGPAEKAGLKVGDKVLSVNGKAVKSRADVVQAITSLSPGDKVALKLEREGWSKPAELLLTEKPGAKAPDKGTPDKGTPDKGTPDKGPRRGFLGVSVQPQEDESKKGVRVASVIEGSAAAKAALKEGDVITAVDGKTIDTPETFVASMQGHKPGDKVKLTVEREGWGRDFTVELGERPANLDQPRQPRGDDDEDEHGEHRDEPRSREKAPAAPAAWLGVAVIEKDGALVVDEVAPKSPAAEAKLEKGAVLAFRTDGKDWKPASADELAKFLGSKKAGDTVQLVLEKDGWTRVVGVKLAERPQDK